MTKEKNIYYDKYSEKYILELSNPKFKSSFKQFEDALNAKKLILEKGLDYYREWRLSPEGHKAKYKPKTTKTIDSFKKTKYENIKDSMLGTMVGINKVIALEEDITYKTSRIVVLQCTLCNKIKNVKLSNILNDRSNSCHCRRKK